MCCFMHLIICAKQDTIDFSCHISFYANNSKGAHFNMVTAFDFFADE
jgi:hypothetical protein